MGLMRTERNIGRFLFFFFFNTVGFGIGANAVSTTWSSFFKCLCSYFEGGSFRGTGSLLLRAEGRPRFLAASVFV